MNNFRRFSVWVPIDEWIVGENNLKLMKNLLKRVQIMQNFYVKF